MNNTMKADKQQTSVLTYVIAVVAVAIIGSYIWNQLYQGVDANKAAALEQQKEMEKQIKEGTYKYPPKWGPPKTSTPTPDEAHGNAEQSEPKEEKSESKEEKEADKPSGEIEATKKTTD